MKFQRDSGKAKRSGIGKLRSHSAASPKPCCCGEGEPCNYYQARQCPLPGTDPPGPLRDVWVAATTIEDAGGLPYYFTTGCGCYYIDDTCPCGNDPGTQPSHSEIDGCGQCGCGNCVDDVIPEVMIVEFNSVELASSIDVYDDDANFLGTATITGALEGPYSLLKATDIGGCDWLTRTMDVTLTWQPGPGPPTTAATKYETGYYGGVYIRLSRILTTKWAITVRFVTGNDFTHDVAIFEGNVTSTNCTEPKTIHNDFTDYSPVPQRLFGKFGTADIIGSANRTDGYRPDDCGGYEFWGYQRGCRDVYVFTTSGDGAFASASFTLYRDGCSWRSDDGNATLIMTSGFRWELTIVTDDGTAVWDADLSVCPPGACDFFFLGFSGEETEGPTTLGNGTSPVLCGSCDDCCDTLKFTLDNFHPDLDGTEFTLTRSGCIWSYGYGSLTVPPGGDFPYLSVAYGCASGPNDLLFALNVTYYPADADDANAYFRTWYFLRGPCGGDPDPDIIDIHSDDLEPNHPFGATISTLEFSDCPP